MDNLIIMNMKISKLLVSAAIVILAAGCNNNKNMETEVPGISAFPTGNRMSHTNNISAAAHGWLR